jgi:uncharacterized protein
MILPDVNVLLYAFRKDVPQHAICKPWLERVVGGEAAYAISRLALSALVRISTGRRAYAVPSTLDEAFGFCDALIAQPNCRIVEPGERHWSIFERLCRETDTRGPRVTDAWFAALAIEHGCEWVTMDRDYARFAGLRWMVPT